MIQSTSGLVLCCCFTDIDELAEFINTRRNLQLTQLSQEKFRSELLFVAFDEATFSFSQASCPVYNLGEKSSDHVDFSCILESDRDRPGVISHNQNLSHDTLFGFDSTRGVRLIVPANMRFCNVQIRQDVLQDCLEAMDRPDLDQDFFKTNYISLPATLPIVKSYLTDLFHLTQQQPELLKIPHFKKIILEDLIPLIIEAIPPRQSSRAQSLRPITRALLVKQAEDYMMANLHQPLTVNDLCRELNANSRSIFYGFQEIFGMAPMAYLKVQRLHSVRRRLKAADPERDSVTAIANQFGFWSAGHFARDYKKMFGERPSQTIQQFTRINQLKV
ncbi:MAG: helix-turn-helix domain-containing protein [Microcoleaceae cyanobacterium]